MTPKYRPKANSLLVLICVISFEYSCIGCSPENPTETSAYLVRIGTTILTETDFNQAFNFQKTAYGDAISDPVLLKQVKQDIFQELMVRAVMLERAREKGIRVSSQETEAAIQAIQRTYPPGEFEKTLLESAISFRAWRNELKTRLLIDKLLQKDITIREIVAPEVADVDRKMEERLQRDGVEAAYSSWIRRLQWKYPVDINELALHHILNRQPIISSK